MIFPERSQTQIISALKALGEPNRLRILCGLGLECRPVIDIINSTGLGQTNVSFHLRVLREAGFVRAERRGAFIYYCLADTELLHILHGLKHWLEALHAPVTGAVKRRNRQARHNSAGAKIKEAS